MIIKVINNSFILSLVNFGTLIKVFFDCIVHFVKGKVGRKLRLSCLKNKYNYIAKCIKQCMAISWLQSVLGIIQFGVANLELRNSDLLQISYILL